MLPAAHRLKGDANFKLLVRKGRSFFSPLFSLRVLPQHGPTRIAFVVSTRVSKKAVSRNRLRRQLREIVRLAMPQIAPDRMVLIQAKPSALGRTYEDLRNELMPLLLKARLMEEKR